MKMHINFLSRKALILYSFIISALIAFELNVIFNFRRSATVNIKQCIISFAAILIYSLVCTVIYKLVYKDERHNNKIFDICLLFQNIRKCTYVLVYLIYIFTPRGITPFAHTLIHFIFDFLMIFYIQSKFKKVNCWQTCLFIGLSSVYWIFANIV